MQYHNVTLSLKFLARNVFGVWTNQAILIGLNKSHLWVWYFTLNNTCMPGTTPNKC